MKRNLRFIQPLVFAAAGAYLSAASTGFSGEADTYELRVNEAQTPAWVEIDEPAGAERRRHTTTTTMMRSDFGTLGKASDIIGMEVRDRQNQKLGEIKDVMVDVHSGRVPFVVLSTGGALDIGDKLIAMPPSALQMRAERRTLTLNMDKQRLQTAPSFERDQWPDMSNPEFSTRVYQFYGTQPYWRSSSYHESSSFSEPAGGEVFYEPSGGARVTTYREYGTANVVDPEEIDREGDRKLHLYQRGKHAAEFTDRQLKEKGDPEVVIPAGEYGSYSRSSEYHTRAPGAVVATDRTRIHDREYRATTSGRMMQRGEAARIGRLQRASELLGMNVEDAQGENLGEIKDIIIDMNSGRVSYAVFDPVSGIGVGDRWVAVPPSSFLFHDNDTLVFNNDRQILRSAPAWDRTNWRSVSDQAFVQRVYRHYSVEPYWRAGTQFREPAGAPGQEFHQEQQFRQERREFDSQGQFQQQQQQAPEQSEQSQQLRDLQSGAQSEESAAATLEQDTSIEEPAGAPQRDFSLEQSSEQKSELSTESTETEQATPAKESPERSITESAGAEAQQPPAAPYPPQPSDPSATPSATTESSSIQSTESTEISTPSAGVESQPASGQIQEQSGAQSSTAIQSEQSTTLQGQTGPQLGVAVEDPAGAATGSNAALVQKVKTEIQSVPNAQQVQVSSEGGKIVLKGSVSSETEKQQVEQKVQEILIDNQIQVQGATGAQEAAPQSQPDSAQPQSTLP